MEYTRNPIISVIAQEVDSLLGKSCFQEMCDQRMLNVILVTTLLIEQPNTELCIDQLNSLERLLHNLAGVRYRTLKLLHKKQF